MEKLKSLFGDKALTFAELEAALQDNKEIKLVNLAAGGYVGKDKLDSAITEKNRLSSLLDEANKQIQNFKDMDIDGIKRAAEEYKKKYEDAEQEYTKKLAELETDNALKDKLSGIKFTSDYARRGVFDEIKAKGLKYENGNFLGFDDALNAIKTANPNAFNDEKPSGATGGTHHMDSGLNTDSFIASVRAGAGLDSDAGKEG